MASPLSPPVRESENHPCSLFTCQGLAQGPEESSWAPTRNLTVQIGVGTGVAKLLSLADTPPPTLLVLRRARTTSPTEPIGVVGDVACGSRHRPRLHVLPLVPSAYYRLSVRPRDPGVEVVSSVAGTLGIGPDSQDPQRFQENKRFL